MHRGETTSGNCIVAHFSPDSFSLFFFSPAVGDVVLLRKKKLRYTINESCSVLGGDGSDSLTGCRYRGFLSQPDTPLTSCICLEKKQKNKKTKMNTRIMILQNTPNFQNVIEKLYPYILTRKDRVVVCSCYSCLLNILSMRDRS